MVAIDGPHAVETSVASGVLGAGHRADRVVCAGPVPRATKVILDLSRIKFIDAAGWVVPIDQRCYRPRPRTRRFQRLRRSARQVPLSACPRSGEIASGGGSSEGRR
jgi:hypothetical protein